MRQNCIEMKVSDVLSCSIFFLIKFRMEIWSMSKKDNNTPKEQKGAKGNQ